MINHILVYRKSNLKQRYNDPRPLRTLSKHLDREKLATGFLLAGLGH
jgi:hypothetical protein